MIFEKLPACHAPSLCLCCCECLLPRFLRPFSIFDIDYGVDDGDLSISSAHPSSSSSSSSGRCGFLAAMVVVVCARFAPSPLDDVSHREGCSNKFWAEDSFYYSNVPILGNWVEYRFGRRKILPTFMGHRARNLGDSASRLD